MARHRFKSIGHYRLAPICRITPVNARRKLSENHGLSLSEGMVAETPASVKSEIDLEFSTGTIELGLHDYDAQSCNKHLHYRTS